MDELHHVQASSHSRQELLEVVVPRRQVEEGVDGDHRVVVDEDDRLDLKDHLGLEGAIER